MGSWRVGYEVAGAQDLVDAVRGTGARNLDLEHVEAQLRSGADA
ncbi:hypothetical protein QQY66_41740 [Streptomyces sp. DG2A-72]|nr:hypothetical protein [Streptomyces sp. DG2A-72]MDO0937935.1 hypothetical protein [Streptomyces sp. DG2A-72]